MANYLKVSLLIITWLVFGFNLRAQTAEQEIVTAVASINEKLAEVKQLAQQKKIYEAMDKLKEAYDEIEHERKWGTFDEKFIEAKKQNPSFTFKINSDLPAQLSPAFWADFESKCDKILADQDVMIAGFKSEVTMNNWSKALAYGKQLKTLYETVSGIIENVGSANLPKLVYDLNGNINDAFDNIIELENAEVEDLEIEAKKAKWNLTVAKTEKAKDKYNDFTHYIKTQKSLITDFNVSINYINKIKFTAMEGPLEPLTYADNKYNWNYGPFQKDVIEACADFETYDIKCDEFKRNFEDINKEALADWAKIKANIEGSDDKAKKNEFLEYNKRQWPEYLSVVNPIFNKTYNKACGTNQVEKPNEESLESSSSINERTLDIQSLKIVNPAGSPADYFIQGNHARIDFKAVWSGQWLDRVKMKITLEGKVILDELLEFRDRMGVFQTDFYKTIVIPENWDDGEYTLSLEMERDPNILNKNITLKCAPKTIRFRVGEGQSDDADTNQSDNNEADNNLNEESIDEENKTNPNRTASTIAVAQGGTSEKYWEIRIPEDADKEWMINGDEYEVRYRINGRTVGFRAFKDPEFLIPAWEMIMNNITIKHGLYRLFKQKTDGSLYVSEIQLYNENKEVGPKVQISLDGSVRYWNTSLDKYKSQLQKDPDLHPISIYEDEYVLEYFPSEPDLSIKYMYGDLNVNAVSEFQLPTNPIKLIEINSVNSESITEHLYSYNPTHHYIGRRTISNYNSENPLISGYKIQKGYQILNVAWWKDGNLNFLECMYNSSYYKSSSSEKIGIKKEYSQPTYIIPDGNVQPYKRGEEYLKLYANNNKLPKPDLFNDFELNRPVYFAYPDPVWASSNPLNLGMGNSQLWRGDMHNFSSDFNDKNFRFYYVSNNNISAISRWFSGKHTEYIVFKDLHKIYRIEWFSNTKPRYLEAIGHLRYNGLRFEWNEDGSFKPDRHPTTGRITLEYLKKYENIPNAPSLEVLSSARLKPDQNLPPIPQSEITPMFEKIWGKDNIVIATTSYEPIFEQTQTDNNQSEKTDLKEEDNYQQLQRQEFFTLGEEIQKIIEQADASFDKKYWEDQSSSRVTMNATNPKQESLDIMRSAIPIIERAKYPENKGALYHLLAMKLINYSGRVFAYNAKQDFFQLAAELINKADQLITANRYLKEDLSDAYCTSGEIWRDMTRKAQWGNHAYNKMDCDRMVIQQYERAVRADPNNTKAKQILAQLKAPKKAVPEVVEKFEKIPDEYWNKAQEEMLRMEDERRIEELNREPEIYPMEVCEMTLTHSGGTVSIMRSGADDWMQVAESHLLLFNGDKIKTSADATGVSITYTSDKTFLAIKNSAEVEIIDENSLMIRRGNAYVQVHKKGKKFLVITPTCAVGVRGTEFEVNVKPDKTAETYLYEGVVEIRNANDIGYLIPGKKMIAKKGEEQLVEEIFDSQERLTKDWTDLEKQKLKHEQIIASSPIRTNEKESSNANLLYYQKLFEGSQAGILGSSETVIHTNTNNDPSPADLHVINQVELSRSPDNLYHFVLVDEILDYGDAALVARCPVKVNVNTMVTINWYLNNKAEAISSGNHQVIPEATYYDGTLVSYDGPLNPGIYRVEFVMNGQLIGQGEINIGIPLRMNFQQAQEAYKSALNKMEKALLQFNQGNFSQAGELAGAALPELQNGLYNAPNLPDVKTVWQTAQAIIAVDKVNQYSLKEKPEETLDWLSVASSYIHAAYANCEDDQFKVSVKQLKDVIELLSKDI